MRYRVFLMVAGIAAVLAALGIYRAGTASVSKQEATPVRQQAVGGVSVAGVGEVKARPDTAYVNLGFSTENTSLAAARNEAATRMKAVLDKIRQLGVAEKDIQTANFNVWRDQERNVFVVSNEVTVIVSNVEASSKLLDEAVAAGANNVHGVSFGIENRAAWENQAREKALQAAKAKAQELARLGGVRIGAPVAISEGATAPEPLYYRDMAGGQAAEDMGAPTPIEPGQLTVTVNVEVTYAIE